MALEQAACLDSRVRLCRGRENRGLGYALNRCAQRAQGRYLARLDDDDVVPPPAAGAAGLLFGVPPPVRLGGQRRLAGGQPRPVGPPGRSRSCPRPGISLPTPPISTPRCCSAGRF